MRKLKPIWIGFLLCALLPDSVHAASEPTLTITVKEGDNARSLARQYLDNPDLWQDILSANKLASAADIKPGMALKIPANQISRAHVELEKCREAIKKATDAGAKVFAGDVIAEAIRLQNDAVSARKFSQWDSCVELAKSAAAKADAALKQTEGKRSQPSEATLVDRTGQVESRKPQDLIWKEAQLQTKFAEAEKVRTLANSAAEIRFQDNSRIKLSENSQAVIQKMRVDMLDRKQQSKVVLVEGDIYALLVGGQQKNNFVIEVPGVQTEVKSSNYWVSKDQQETRLANYDGSISITTQGVTLKLNKNQGVKMSKDKRAEARDLLPGPVLIAPENDLTIYVHETTLSWEKIPGAAKYWLEVAEDRSFVKVLINQQALTQTTFDCKNLKEGVYYWRVAAIDADELPGPKSGARFFKIMRDEQPPFLVVNSPAEKAVVRQAAITIRGEVEINARLTLAGQPISVAADGLFETARELKPGDNALRFEAIDLAGNISSVVRHIYFQPDQTVAVNYDATLPHTGPKQFVSGKADFTLTGQTQPGLRLRVYPQDDPTQVVTAIADAAGRFGVNLKLSTDKVDYILQGLLTSGQIIEDRFSVAVDHEPPQLSLASEVPPATRQSTLVLTGRVAEAISLKLNSLEVVLDDNKFTQSVTLKPGANTLELTAIDAVGNASGLTRTILLDQDAPTLKTHTLSSPLAKGGESLTLTAQVADISDLKAGAEFKLTIGGADYSGYLKRCAGGDCYECAFTIPAALKGPIRLTYLKLGDQLGNEKEYRF